MEIFLIMACVKTGAITRKVIMCLVGPEEKQILVGWPYIEIKSRRRPQTLRKVK